jgi:hypothetical protein
MTTLALLLDDPWLPALYALGLAAFWLDLRWYRGAPLPRAPSWRVATPTRRRFTRRAASR